MLFEAMCQEVLRNSLVETIRLIFPCQKVFGFIIVALCAHVTKVTKSVKRMNGYDYELN